jgi:hypothetical protein
MSIDYREKSLDILYNKVQEILEDPTVSESIKYRLYQWQQNRIEEQSLFYEYIDNLEEVFDLDFLPRFSK